MRRVPAVLALTGVALVAAACPALAGPHAASDSVVDGTQVHQEINVWKPDTIHYWFHATNPEGVRPFCVTLQLERKSDGDWKRIGKGSARDRACCPQPEEECFPTATEGVWDLFLYPKGTLRRRVMDGRIRIRGFSDFGPAITLRLNAPPV
jgi:hypothetical protein